MNGDKPSLTNIAPNYGGGGDLLSLVLPAMLGAKIGGQDPFMGRLGGALMAAGNTVDTQRKWEGEQSDINYHQALQQQAQAGAEETQAKLDELRKAAKDKEAYAATLSDEERPLFNVDPEAFVKRKALSSGVPVMAKIVGGAFAGDLSEEDLSKLDPSVLAQLMPAAVTAIKGNRPLKIEYADIEGMGRVPFYTDPSDGQKKPLIPKAGTHKLSKDSGTEFVGGVQHKFAYNYDQETGQVVSKVDLGPEKLLAQERSALESEKVGLQQANRLLENMSSIDESDVSKMAAEGWKYNHSTIAGLLGQATGGRVGGFDRRYVEIFTNMGQLEASLQRALTNGRVAEGLYNRLIAHVPHTGEPPEITYDKLRSLVSDKGLMKQMRDAIQNSGDQVSNQLKQQSGPESAPAATSGGYKSVEEFKAAHPGIDLEPVGE